jgi:NADH-quinone oxidoreductase subunit J
MDISQIIFLVVAAVIVVSALAVVTMPNLIHAALMLIVTLFAIAVLYVLLNAGFMAAVQVVLYIGAIAILIIFAMMLTRRVMADEQVQVNSQWGLGLFVALASFAGLVVLIWGTGSGWSPLPPATDASLNNSIALLGRALTSPGTNADPAGFLLPFQVAGILLTVAFVGAVAVAGEKK